MPFASVLVELTAAAIASKKWQGAALAMADDK
jgi:hypothetical protein